MTKTICDYCFSEFAKREARVRKHNYCCRECWNKAHANRKSVNCLICNKIVEKRCSVIHSHTFCSKACASKYVTPILVAASKARRVEHRVADHPLYQTWASMKARCYSKNNRSYKNYGGRGIKVCDRWLNSFYDFVSDMGLKNSPELSIDRINTNGNYEPGNCRWATIAQQNRNSRQCYAVDSPYGTYTLSETARKLGISRKVTRKKIKRGELKSCKLYA